MAEKIGSPCCAARSTESLLVALPCLALVAIFHRRVFAGPEVGAFRCPPVPGCGAVNRPSEVDGHRKNDEPVVLHDARVLEESPQER